MVLSSTTMAAHARLATPLSSPVPLLGVTPDSMIPLIGGKGRAQMVWDMLRTGGACISTFACVIIIIFFLGMLKDSLLIRVS